MSPSTIARRPQIQAWPIVDLRRELSWPRRLPARFGTLALWAGSFALLGPAKLVGVVAVFGLAFPGAWLLDRCWRQGPKGLGERSSALISDREPLPLQLERAALAARFAVSEAQLFRARHASVCTVVYNEEGQLIDLLLPGSLPSSRSLSHPQTNAHLVG